MCWSLALITHKFARGAQLQQQGINAVWPKLFINTERGVRLERNPPEADELGAGPLMRTDKAMFQNRPILALLGYRSVPRAILLRRDGRLSHKLRIG